MSIVKQWRNVIENRRDDESEEEKSRVVEKSGEECREKKFITG